MPEPPLSNESIASAIDMQIGNVIRGVSDGSDCAVYAASDLHVDYAENRAFVARWSSNRYLRDTLIVAGDVSDDVEALERTLTALVRKFRYVFFVPGLLVCPG